MNANFRVAQRCQVSFTRHLPAFSLQRSHLAGSAIATLHNEYCMADSRRPTDHITERKTEDIVDKPSGFPLALFQQQDRVPRHTRRCVNDSAHRSNHESNCVLQLLLQVSRQTIDNNSNNHSISSCCSIADMDDSTACGTRIRGSLASGR